MFHFNQKMIEILTFETARQGRVRRGGPMSLAADRYSRAKLLKWSKIHDFEKK